MSATRTAAHADKNFIKKKDSVYYHLPGPRYAFASPDCDGAKAYRSSSVVHSVDNAQDPTIDLDWANLDAVFPTSCLRFAQRAAVQREKRTF